MKAFVILSALSIAASASKIIKRQDNSTVTVTAAVTTTDAGLPISVEAVLLTALPSSLLALAETNAAAASSLIASELEYSETPAWFSALPTDIQTYLVAVSTATTTVTPTLITSPSNITIGPGPVVTTATVAVYNTTSVILPSFTTYTNGSTAANGTIIANNGTVIATGNSTTATAGYNATTSRTYTPIVTATTTVSRSSSSGSASSSSSAAASSTSTGGAALPTGIVSVAVVGAMGLLGVFVL